ncbi:MAG TPA: chemotaxis-specific protein-glutamate methyltransferase CheB [Thermoanaerobaculia bacterium]|jgi:two-component system chemotaxis response regulator CheB|nr:chemotaxis-specific protein-glutamate methyltransferase CheB [Thermoanaerobaculia bacterium]
MTPLHVLVIDDSAVVRQVMTALLGKEMSVTTAADPLIAMMKMETRRPDVIVLDLEMPRMDGLTFLRKLMNETPLPVVVCSSLTESSSELTMRALQLGAVDVVLKPKVRDSADALIDTIRGAAQAKVGRLRRTVIPSVARDLGGRGANHMPRNPSHPGPSLTFGMTPIVIGASTGGTEVLKQLFDAMPADAPPIVAVQHMPERFTNAFARRLNETSAMTIREAVPGDIVRPGTALIAPGDRHLALAWQAPGSLGITLHDAPLVNRHRPSVDVLFASAARMLGSSAIGVLLTGMGRDGARGLLEMRKAGALTIAQDEASSIVFGMPGAAIDLGAAMRIVAADHIAATLLDAVKGDND